MRRPIALAAFGLLSFLLLPQQAPSERFWATLPLIAAASLLSSGRSVLPLAGLFLSLWVASHLLGMSQISALFRGLPAAPLEMPLTESAAFAWHLSGLFVAVFALWRPIRETLSADERASIGRQLAPALVIAPILAPVLLSNLFIHRIKLPDVLEPARAAESVWIRSDDGLPIAAWFVPREGATRTVLIGHGLSANRSAFLPFLAISDRLDANALLIDLRGHGESGGRTLSFGCNDQRDIAAAVSWLRSERAPQARQIVGAGISLSTAGLVLAASRVDPPLDGLVLDSAFPAPVELTDGVLWYIPGPLRRLLLVPGLPLASLEAGCWLPSVRPSEAVRRVRAPIWLAHAERDPLIPLEKGRAMYDAAREPKELYVSPTPGHGIALLEGREGYLDSLGRFFDAHLKE